MATARPTTTGGKAIPVLIMLKMRDRPRKFPSASQVPNGKPIRRLRQVASVETCKERTVIWKTSESKTIRLHPIIQVAEAYAKL
jgi:hypothetical protein